MGKEGLLVLISCIMIVGHRIRVNYKHQQYVIFPCLQKFGYIINNNNNNKNNNNNSNNNI